MLGSFSNIPEFVDGQELSAQVLSDFSENLAKLESVVYGPQSLPLDSWLLSPKAIPLSLAVTSQELFVGSFLYRPGLTRLEIGVYLSLEAAYTPETTADFKLTEFNNQFNTKCGSLALGVVLGGPSNTTEYYPKEDSAERAIVQFNGQYSLPSDSISITLNGNPYSQQNTKYTATLTNGQVTAGQAVHQLTGQRLHTISVDLTTTAFLSGEVVPVKVVLLGSGTDKRRKISANFTDRGSAAYPGLATLAKQVYRVAKADFKSLYYLKYNTLYAHTIGDLSYTTNWSDTTFPTSGLVDSTALNQLRNKHNYMTERIQTRPRPLTGSFVAFPVFSNSSAVFYPQFPSDNTILGSQPTAFGVQPFNAEATFATYSWNPQFSIYDQVNLYFKLITNTRTHSFFTVDLTDTPASQATYRRAEVFEDFTSGYATSGGDTTSTKYPHIMTADRYTSRLLRTLGSGYRSYLTKPFQVRIPSITTPVFERRTGSYTDGFYFEGGNYYEDRVAIDFQKKYEEPAFSFWGLAKGVDGYTSQIGLFSEIPSGLIPDGLELTTGLANRIYSGEVYKAIPGYNSVYSGEPNATYAQHWAWVSSSGAAIGPKNLIVHHHDYSDRFIKDKSSYIGFTFFYGSAVSKSNADTYSEYLEYAPMISYSVSGIHQAFQDFDTRLTNLYNDTYRSLTESGLVVNPHYHTEPIFWGAPTTPLLRYDEFIRDYTEKCFYHTGRRIGDLLVVRGRNVTLYTGDLKKVERSTKPEGSVVPVSEISWEFSYSQSILSGDYEGTAIVDLTQVEGLPYGGYYHVQGDSVVYAAEFFEDVI